MCKLFSPAEVLSAHFIQQIQRLLDPHLHVKGKGASKHLEN